MRFCADASDPAALLALRNTHGMSPVMVARRVAPNSGVVADLMSAAEKCGASTVLELEEDLTGVQVGGGGW